LPEGRAVTTPSYREIDAHERDDADAAYFEMLRDRLPRRRLLGATALGVSCLAVAQWLYTWQMAPAQSDLDGLAWRTSIVLGLMGIWLVPGLWLSALMIRSGSGLPAWLATRIGVTLAWYALVGPVVHQISGGARVTTGVLVGATVAATAAVCLGVALGLVRRPGELRTRTVLALLIGGLCAQCVMWAAMALWPHEADHSALRQLNWLIVLTCAVLTAVGMRRRPQLPALRSRRHTRMIVVSVVVIEMTAAILLVAGGKWSPEQRMPSAFSAEQVVGPTDDYDLVFALTAISPEGAELIQRADFHAFDDTGRPVPARILAEFTQHTADHVVLLVILDPESRPFLCDNVSRVDGRPSPAKLTLRDGTSNLLVQGVIAPEWCEQ
jgi:hypothetical protein